MSGNNSRRGQEDDHGPPHPSARLPHVCPDGHTWLAHALSHFTSVRYGRIASVSAAHDATQFGDSICPVCVSTFKFLFNMTQSTRALIDTDGGYYLEAPNIRSDHSPSFPSSILYFPLIAPLSLQLCHSFHHLAKPYRTSIDIKGPVTSGF
jgi:hypothetical protein